MTKRLALALQLVMAVALPAVAAAAAIDESPWYVGAGLGEVGSDWTLSASFGEGHSPDLPPGQPVPVPVFSVYAEYDTQGGQLGFVLGRRVGRFLRLETQVASADLGSPKLSILGMSDFLVDADIRARNAYSVGLTALPELRLSERWSVYGRLGWHFQELRFDIDTGAQPQPEMPAIHTDGPLVGGGVLWRGGGRFDFFAELEERDLDRGSPRFSGWGSWIEGSERGYLFGSVYHW